MAGIPYGPNNSIKSKKELGQVLLGIGYMLGFVAILALAIMLYAKSYKNSTELIAVAGIPGAIALVLLVLGNSFLKKTDGSFRVELAKRRSRSISDREKNELVPPPQP